MIIVVNAQTGEITERELTAEEKIQMEVEIYELPNDEMIIEVEDKLEELQAKIDKEFPYNE